MTFLEALNLAVDHTVPTIVSRPNGPRIRIDSIAASRSKMKRSAVIIFPTAAAKAATG